MLGWHKTHCQESVVRVQLNAGYVTLSILNLLTHQASTLPTKLLI